MEIKVKPEQLEQIAKNISEMQTHSQNIQQNLNQSMFSIQMQWQGATSQHFYGEYMRSMRLMESYIRNLQVTEKELRRIAQKFRQADEEYQKKQNEKLKEAHKKEKKNEKSWWEKGIEGAAEFIGVNDAIRAVTGKDPITGKELSTKERLIAAGWTLLNFVPVGKVASLAGKGIKYVASSFGKTIVKAGKKLGEGVTMVAGKAGKAAVDGIKTASHKVTEGVNFVASTAKGFADKIGSLWNKGATTVKTTFLQGNEKIQHAVKTLMEYKWIPGEGKGFAMAGVGNVSGGGQYSLKEAYQYMESKVVKGTGKVYPTRQIDLVAEAHIIDRVKELRGNLSSKYKKAGNFALAEVDVNSLNKKEFYASSKIDEFKGNLEEKVPEISLKPNEPIFEASLAPGKDGKPYMRDSDTEYKILNEIALKLGDDVNATGKIKLFTELDTCDSCSKVIAEFANKYKNIELEVIHNNGERLKP
ncbi:TPA: WXG100 family type VII secretion target [Bacillus anthracis]|uniref:WXG100 family type VII secretion target n=3 Tax=Bacillus cereus group TaxID=86661 RepID=UPI0001DBFBB1|nr:WXG100 family type VII secretion target [Bacillus cereus]HDR4495863.1 WXG100 family type VII secretion target [Bacillus cereus biovar anthracis]ADK04800.1 conserved domain protein [Bacillus cereus biovar anthracis str. CI]HDR6228703.1 WXG100 family type VII secretion target [Bacillus cereus biovar anthracis]HDR6235378.1 WXG100 family type VII secretion target [Bacillus cereus biovar anthracis]HDR6239122.1 WXG100 family type VII secretion target [Bacillus cereus biovar anthracis]